MDLSLPNFDPLIHAIAPSVGQSQRDVSAIAKATDYVQTPEFKQQLQKVETGVVAYGATSLALQAISTGCMVLMAYVAWKSFKRGK